MLSKLRKFGGDGGGIVIFTGILSFAEQHHARRNNHEGNH